MVADARADPLDDITGRSVLVVGDVMLDEHLWGSRGSARSEANAPIVAVESVDRALGGAGNVAANAVGLGAQTYLVGTTGPDQAGELVRDLTARLGAHGCFVSSTTRPTPRKSRVYADGRQLVRFDQEVCTALEPVDETAVAKLSIELLDDIDVLIVSDYAKGTVTARVAAELMAEARRRETMAVVDSKARRPDCYRGCTAVTPEVRELATWASRRLDRDDYPAAARALAERLDGPLVLVTEGAAGMTLFDAGSCCHLPPRVEPAIDTLGAGDAVVAAFARGLAAGRAPVAAAALASAAAGVVVQRRGTHAVSTDALRRMLLDGSALVTDDGVR